MTDSVDERLSGDLPVAPTQFEDQEGPSLSHAVIASYVADAARTVRGVVDLHTSPWKGLQSRMREIHSGGVVLKESETQPGSVDVGIHVRVAWGAVIPELARKVEEAVRRQAMALLNLELGSVTLFIDEIAAPVEAGSLKEG
jgi:uncharacterized alkaline shock family protein YloU